MAGAPALINPLATVTQLQQSSSQLDGIPIELERSVLFAGARLTQQAGILLSLRQDVIAQAMVLFMRFWAGPEGGSLKQYGVKDISMACLYVTAKASATPKYPRNLINVYSYLSVPGATYDPSNFDEVNFQACYVSEADYYRQRAELFKYETVILRTLGFQLHVALPYNLCINYLQVLDVLHQPLGKRVANRVIQHLNTALLNPQQLYLTHQPASLATSAMYLAAKETGLKMPEGEWWEIFDVSREELGFLVVAHLSMAGFAEDEKKRWTSRNVPLTVAEVENELLVSTK